MSTLSGIAAALLLGLSIYAAVPIFTNDQEPQPPRTEIAFQAAESTPDATADTQDQNSTTASATPSRDVPSDVIYTGDAPITNADGAPYTPPQGTELTGVVGSDVRNPVSPSECVIEPRSREDVVAVLSTPPAEGNSQPPYSESTVDEATLGEIQATFRQWQACTRFGKTFQAAALETDQFIRTDFYDDGGVLGTWQLIDTPYSEETINGVLDGRIELDNAKSAHGDKQAQGAPGSESGLNLNLWVIDTTDLRKDPDSGAYFAGDNDTFISVPVVWTNPSLLSGSSGNTGRLPSAYVSFQLVDGQWKVADWMTLSAMPPVVD